MRRDNGFASFVVAIATLALTVTACAPTPTLSGAPQVMSFGPLAAVGGAPALTPVGWTIVDPDGEDLTCRLDFDNDGTWDVTVPHCQGSSSRNHTYGAGATIATIEVNDGYSAPVTATTTIIVGPVEGEPFNIVVRPVQALAPAVQSAFAAAALRWESVIAAGLPDQNVSLPASACLDGSAPLIGTIDDIVVDVDVSPIDGVGGTLGAAGPCVIDGAGFPRVGSMMFDSADVTSMLGDGTFTPVVEHEMAHILGFGTIWDTAGHSLLTGAGTSSPLYTGPRAVNEWNQLGGTDNVPVENTGGAGTADAHWRESVFGAELMTGFISPGVNPLSALSIASLADLGYRVNISQADAYALPGAALRAPRSAETRIAMVLREPRYTI